MFPHTQRNIPTRLSTPRQSHISPKPCSFVFFFFSLSKFRSKGEDCSLIDWNIEKALNLARMQVHRDDMVAPCRLQHIRDKLRRYRSSGFVLLVLARVGKVRDNGRDASSTGGFARVDHDEKLHQPIVDVPRGGGLKDENVLIADRLAYCYGGLLVRVLEDGNLCEFYPKSGTECLNTSATHSTGAAGHR